MVGTKAHLRTRKTIEMLRISLFWGSLRGLFLALCAGARSVRRCGATACQSGALSHAPSALSQMTRDERRMKVIC